MNTNNIHHNPLTFNPRVPKLQTQQRKQRNYQNLKPTYEAMNWKQYAINRPRNISLEDVDRKSAKNSVRQHHSPSSYYDHELYDAHNTSQQHMSVKKVREQNLRLSGVTYNSKREQHAVRVKQDAMRRVKMLQQKVLPLITSDRNNYNEQQNQQYGFAWQMKMQQKLMKIQTSIERVKNQIQIKYEKRLLELQRQWEERIQQLLMGVSQNFNNGNLNVNGSMQQQQQLVDDNANEYNQHQDDGNIITNNNSSNINNNSHHQQQQQQQQRFMTNNNNNNINNKNNPSSSAYNYYRSGFNTVNNNNSNNNNNNQQYLNGNQEEN